MLEAEQSIGSKLRLRRMRVRGFKALVDIDLAIPDDMLILIGGNGSGKSSILQALTFVNYLSRGQPTGFFQDRGWNPSDVRTKIKSSLRSGLLSYRLLLEDENGHKLFWYFSWHLNEERMHSEQVWVVKHGDIEPTRVLSVLPGRPTKVGVEEIRGIKSSVSYINLLDPSSLSRLDGSIFSALAKWGSGIFSLELLSPVEMRRGARGSPSDIGPRGERLGGFLASLTPDQKKRLVERLTIFYPLEHIDTTRKRAGWVDLNIAEHFNGLGKIPVAHMSDGFMRLLGLASVPEFSDAASTVLLDEVEDGIEPHILPGFIKLIAKESKTQLIMTSHSPILVNQFDPNQIAFVARDLNGCTKVATFTQIEELKSGLEYFGPGELWTNLEMSMINERVLAESVSSSQISEMRKSSVGLPSEQVARFMGLD